MYSSLFTFDFLVMLSARYSLAKIVMYADEWMIGYIMQGLQNFTITVV